MTQLRDCIRATDSVMIAAQQLVAAGINAVPVVDDAGRPLGALRNLDVIAAAATGTDIGQIEVAELDSVKRRAMKPAPAVDADDPVEEVVSAMNLHGSSHLPVVEGDRVVGVVSRPRTEGLCYVAPDGLPLPPRDLIHLIQGQARTPRPYQTYYENGVLAAETVRTVLERNGFEVETRKSILDFGCGCGRVMRHWRRLAGVRLCGSDYNPAMVEWCSTNLPFAEFSVNGLEPALDYPDAAFDLAYAISVFAHLDTGFQRPWMSELKRVLAPRGLLLVTLMGFAQLDAMKPDERRAFLAGRLVVRQGERSGENACLAYHPETYVRGEFGGGLELVDFVPSRAPGVTQDVALFMNPG